MSTPHVHVNEICAWARGKKIQVWVDNTWVNTIQPTWFTNKKYRVKPIERWKFAIYFKEDGIWREHLCFMTDEEAADALHGEQYIKLEHTRMEFPDE